ncbi:MAG TPA: hypothetical protein VGN52_07050 [Burkholderiales bacterium]|jgi:hypothetical protein
MRALLVGGPLHGQMVALEEHGTSSTVRAHADGVEYVYRPRSEPAGHQVVLYSVGTPSYNQVVDAIRKSDLLSSTGKLRVLGPDDTLPANDAG